MLPSHHLPSHRLHIVFWRLKVDGRTLSALVKKRTAREAILKILLAMIPQVFDTKKQIRGERR